VNQQIGGQRWPSINVFKSRRPRRAARGRTVVLGLVSLLGTTLLLPAEATAEETSADVVIEWNANAQPAIIGTAGQGPTVAYLHFAMVQGAVYDAVIAIEGGYEPYLGAPPMAGPEDSSPAAAAAAAHHVLAALFPGPQATLDAKLASSLAGISDGPAKTGGIEVGEAAAPPCSLLGPTTGDSARFTVVEGFDPGEWRRTPPAFALRARSPGRQRTPVHHCRRARLRSDGPNALSSADYAEDFNEVKAFGSLNSIVSTAGPEGERLSSSHESSSNLNPCACSHLFPSGMPSASPGSSPDRSASAAK
jgi:hypothetical protein